jgi:hypothetical protein
MSILFKNKNTGIIEPIFNTSNISSNNILNLDQGLKINSINSNLLYDLNVTGNINFTGGLFQNDIPFSSNISANIANIYKYLFSDPYLIGANFIPTTSGKFSLGNITNNWKSLYITDGFVNGSINIGNNFISSNNANLIINANNTVNLNGNLFIGKDINFVGNIYQNGKIFQGPTGPAAGVLKSLPSMSYYLSSNISVVSNYTTTVMFDTYDSLNSSGSCDFRYNTATGVLINPTSDVMTINLSGQLQTSNTAFDVTQYQPVISIVKNNNNIVSSSVLNYQGSSFSTVLVLNPNDQIIVTFKQYFSSPILIQAGQYTTRITYTQLNNIFSYTGYTGSTGPAGVAFSLPSTSYYLSANVTVPSLQNTIIIYDQFDSLNSNGNPDFTYNINTGLLTNPTSQTMTILIAGQLQTSNEAFDVTQNQPIICIVKNNNNIISSSVLNFQGSSFTTTLILYPNDIVSIKFQQYFNNSMIILAGQYITRITYTQLNNMVARTGSTGPTGFTGPAGNEAALPSLSYYLSSNIAALPLTDTVIKYNTVDSVNSNGNVGFLYNTGTGILTNPTSDIISVLINGQVQTSNESLDVTQSQPIISVVKNNNNIISSSTLNYQGSSFSTTIILYPSDNVSVMFKQYFSNTIFIQGGQYTTRITYTQLNNVIMQPGATGPTGPLGTNLSLPSVSYYLSSNINVLPLQNTIIKYDSIDNINSSGLINFTYNPSNGILTNTGTNLLTILVSGQLQTDNSSFDVTQNQPVIYIVKNNDNIISSSVLNYQGSSFSSTIILAVGDTIKIMFMQYFSQSVNIVGGQFITRITWTQLNNVTVKPGDTGSTGATGPAGNLLSLPSISYYLSSNVNVLSNQTKNIIYDTYDSLNSNGIVSCTYNVVNGFLTNSSNNIITILVSGQLQTDNVSFDVTQYQPVIYIVKNTNNVMSSSVLNYQGSSFSSTIILNSNESINISFQQYFSNSINILGGQYITRITFTQLNNVQVAPGATGPTGFIGSTGFTGSTGATGPIGAYIQYGTAITNVYSFSIVVIFPQTFDSVPNVMAIVSDSSRAWVSIGGITRYQFTAYTWNTTGGVSATINWQALL